MKTKIWKRLTAGLLVLVMAITLTGVRASAAEKTVKSVKYVKEFKLFIKKEGTQKDAADWCKTQSDGDWHVAEGDLNDGTDGMFSSKVGVFLCYCTTEDEKEAVRDIAVMNEKGNYSENDYRMILEKQKEEYRDLVSDLKTQIRGYQENLKKEVKTAVTAHDLLNGYKEDDSGKLMGDLLAELDPEQEKDAEKLTDILLQANGEVVLFIQQQLAQGCESRTRNWLDRMEALGGYQKFYKKIKNAFNGDDRKAKGSMEKKYKEKAMVIADAWEQLRQSLEDIKKYEERCGVGSMSEEEVKEWRENNLKSAEGMVFEQKLALAENLAMYKYEEGSLLDFFLQDRSEITGENLHKLYPMVSCLEPGQFAGLNSTVSLYSLINQAFSATLLNDYDKGKLEEVKDAVGADSTGEIEEAGKLVEDSINQQKKEEVKSIYEGVDREVFGGGVAVTSEALDFSNSSEIKWTDTFVEKRYQYAVTSAIGYSVGALTAVFLNAAYNNVLENAAKTVIQKFRNGDASIHFSDKVAQLMNKRIHTDTMDSWLREMAKTGTEEQQKLAKQAMAELEKATLGDSTATKVMYGLSRGLTLALVLVAVADVIMTSIALYNYYNRDHLPIPHHIVDMSIDKSKETSFVSYKSVMDNDGVQGDLNGGSSKQWLALYQTYDENAGDPILAPENGEECKLIVQYGSSKEPETGNYHPLHLFGTPNTPQNLTYADGEKGWSYNDNKKGTYLFFRRGSELTVIDEAAVSESAADASSGNVAVSDSSADDATATDAGTTRRGGTVALVGVLCGAGGLLIGVIGTTLTRRKKKVPGDSREE